MMGKSMTSMESLVWLSIAVLIITLIHDYYFIPIIIRLVIIRLVIIRLVNPRTTILLQPLLY